MMHARRFLVVLALLIALSVGVALIPEQMTQTATAAPASPAVVILVGSVVPISIIESQSSTGAPTFAPGGSLAQALADLHAAGFEIKHVEGQNYTLVRQ